MKNFLIFLFSIIVFTGCSNSEEDSPPNHKELLKKVSILCPPEVQIFFLDAGTDTILVGKKGTQIHIDENTFSSKTYSGKVEIQIEEYYDIGAMILRNLSTATNGKILETDGMVNFKVFVDGLVYNEDFNARIEMPTDLKEQEMSFYYADSFFESPSWELAENDLYEIQDTITELIFDTIDPGSVDILFGMKKFRWLNRDLELFFKDPIEAKMAITAQPEASVFYLVLGDYNVIYAPVFPEKDEITISEVPKNEYGIIIGLAVSENDELLFASKRLQLSKRMERFPPLKPITPKKLKMAMESEFGKDLWSRPN
jgi:hypothetical protein